MNELSAVVRFVHLSAAVLLVGSFAFVLLIARPALEKARIGADDRNVSGRRLHRQIVIWSLFALSVSALLGLCIQIVNVGDPAPRTFFERLAAATLLTDTQYGKVWLFRMVLLMGLSALSGHAATADGAALAMQISADALHLLAGGVWLGGLVPLFAFLRRCNQTTHLGASVAAQEATRRYSRLGLVCVAVLIAISILLLGNRRDGANDSGLGAPDVARTSALLVASAPLGVPSRAAPGAHRPSRSPFRRRGRP